MIIGTRKLGYILDSHVFSSLNNNFWQNQALGDSKFCDLKFTYYSTRSEPVTILFTPAFLNVSAIYAAASAVSLLPKLSSAHLRRIFHGAPWYQAFPILISNLQFLTVSLDNRLPIFKNHLIHQPHKNVSWHSQASHVMYYSGSATFVMTSNNSWLHLYFKGVLF